MARKKRILFGAVDIGWRIEHYSQFIQQNYPNYEVRSVVYYKLPSQHYKTSYTYEYILEKENKIVDWLLRLSFFLRAIFSYDVFYFLSGETLLTRKLRFLEMRIYKLLNKKVVFHFVGTDIRSIEYIKWKEENILDYLSLGQDHSKSNPWQVKLIEDANVYADQIIVSTPDLLPLVSNAIYYPVLIDLDKFLSELDKLPKKHKQNSDEIVILHAPSNVEMKGTKIIEEALLQLVVESDQNIKLLLPYKDKEKNAKYSTTRYSLFEMYKEADIVIDQLIIGWYGLQAVEALLADNLVISYIDAKFENNLFEPCPIVNANALTLKQVLKDAIEKIKNKKVDFQEQRAWVKKHHTIEENNAIFKNILTQ